jgi:pantetheine-phosphate adenylyltransferase
MLALDFEGEPRLRILAFEGTVAELLEKEGTKIYVRGIRNGIDLDYENANFYASKKLDEDITAVYLPCPQELLHVSSTMVRNSLQFGTPIEEYVSEKVKTYIEEIRK